jgi:hypothetical protein
MGSINTTLQHYLGGNFHHINKLLLKEEKKLLSNKFLSKEIDNAEKKDEKFKRLANKRLANAIKQFKLLSNLSNKSHYSYKNNEINEVIKMLRKAIIVNLKKYKV